MQLYLVTPKSCLSGFIFDSDREYFSKPVPVNQLYTEVSTRLVYVEDPARGCRFPTERRLLRGFYGLTDKQRKQVTA